MTEEREAAGAVVEDPGTEMARERTRKAADRTMMAWVRTGLSLIGFGVGLAELRDVLGGAKVWGRTETVGLLFICIGIIGMLFASFEFISRVRHLDRREYTFKRGIPFPVIVALALAAIGVIALVGWFVQWLG
jgi:putative membrane protein